MRVKVKIFLYIFGVIALASAFSLNTNAQTAAPQMVITWRAYGSYAPPKYPDKVLPNQESQIAASLELLLNGKPVDISQQTIYWYLDDTLLASAVGKQYIIFSPFGTPPSYLTLEAELPNYSYNGNSLIHQIQIPLISPRVVIEAPHPAGQFSGNPITLQGTPYFFYASDAGALSYVWSVNGQTSTVAENPQTLQMNINPATPSGSSFAVALTITNPYDSISSDDSTNVIYVKQL